MDPLQSKAAAQTLKERLWAPLRLLLPEAKNQRHCPAITDENWIECGIERGLTELESGCGFLQNLHFHPQRAAPKRSTYFEGFKSTRRLKHLRLLNDSLTRSEAQKALLENPTAGIHPSLQDFHLQAGDGHFHAASTHDLRDHKGRKNATGHLYTLNLRTGLLHHLGLSGKGVSKIKPHDMGSLKRLEIETLRQGAARGQKVLYIWDRAGLDYGVWQRWKQGSGIYFLSREKSNTAFIKCGHLPFDQNDSLNAGVVSDEQGAPGGGHMIRRVTFISPDNGEQLVFLTNLPASIPPGVIAQLYFLRWRIEKSFDVFKNKLHERKSWVKNESAKEAHAGFLVLSYNLGWQLHRELEREEGVKNVVNEKKQVKRQEALETRAKKLGLILPKLRQGVQAATQLSVIYWRWLRSELRIPTPWTAALSKLRQTYEHF
jgi:hypothetical protein